MRKEITILLIILFCMSFFIGIQIGSYLTIKAVASMAIRFVDADLIEKALFQYKNNIGNCYPELLIERRLNGTMENEETLQENDEEDQPEDPDDDFDDRISPGEE